MKARRWLVYCSIATLLAILLSAAAFLASNTGRQVIAEWRAQSPQALIRYAQRRLEGHDTLERLLLPGLRALQRQVERPPPLGPLPTWGKGQQPQMAPLAATTENWVRVDTAAALAEAMLDATPGTRIVVAPGHYRFDKTLRVGHGGRVSAPIAMSALLPGTVRLDFSQQEGILVDHPHWMFENLNIYGTCPSHQTCEHAFHVVGAGAFTTLRNNHLQDFNAHIKVNGLNGLWPDDGVVAFNTLTNSTARQVRGPVVMFDLVGANRWRVQDNLVTNFAKAEGNRVAYGLFMKGSSEGGRFERNLLICSPSGMSDPGERVGISFGGGLTDAQACRTDRCTRFEHRYGLAANNIIAHCNDAGVDINGSRDIVIAHNMLINTAGFSVRNGSTQIRLLSNLFEGNVSARTANPPEMEWNVNTVLSSVFTYPDGLLFNWLHPPTPIPLRAFVTNDFRGARRETQTLPGALEQNFP